MGQVPSKLQASEIGEESAHGMLGATEISSFLEVNKPPRCYFAKNQAEQISLLE